MKQQNTGTKVFALGGLGEVGKNMYIVESNDEIVIIDAGAKFPDAGLLGIDLVLADYTYLKQNEDKIKCLFITHGHEDHIGGIPFLISEINIPVIYAPNIACELIKNKLNDRNIKYKNLKVYNADTIIKFKNISIEFFTTTHSIPDSFGAAITTPDGVIVTTGDFKFDLNPIGPMADIGKMARIAERGVKLLMSDSTNALSSGFSKSESTVDESINEIFSKSKARIIVATFASNIYRITHIVETCKKYNRKVAVFGRSMKNNIEIATECGYITDKKIFISADEANKLPPKDVCVLCTGSQGEPLAALSRISEGTNKQIKLMPNDSIIFSSNPVPGNAMAVNSVINNLYLKGATVYTNSDFSGIHTSGHANQEELKLLLRIFKPEYFMPMHGEYRMLKAHADLATTCDIPKENIFIHKNGDILTLNKDKVYKSGSFPVTLTYVDGNRIGGVGTSIIKERQIMSSDGVLVIILNIDLEKKQLLLSPNITTRGFVIVNENQELIRKIQNKVKQLTETELKKYSFNYTDLKNLLILELNNYISDITGRRPIILPMILEKNAK